MPQPVHGFTQGAHSCPLCPGKMPEVMDPYPLPADLFQRCAEMGPERGVGQVTSALSRGEQQRLFVLAGVEVQVVQHVLANMRWDHHRSCLSRLRGVDLASTLMGRPSGNR